MARPEDVSHLARRAGFGLSRKDRRALVALPNRRAVVDRILDDRRTRGKSATSPAPPDLSTPACTNPAGYSDALAIGRWWLDRMSAASFTSSDPSNPHPLLEKMTVFWHGLLVSSLRKGIVYCHHTTMLDQNRIFRRHGLGRFSRLLTQTTKSPAMLLYLDNYANNKRNVNENYGRELLELFSVGVGNFSQNDVQGAARSGTGYSLVPGGLSHQFYPGLHDFGDKTFDGITGDWDLVGDSGSGAGLDLVEHLSDAGGMGPVTARTLSLRLWQYFAHFTPSQAAIDEIATASMARGDIRIKDALRALFTHPEFYSDAARNGKVKNPVEWAVAMLRGLRMPAPFFAQYGWDPTQISMDDMGLQLFFPPNVFGWWRRPEGSWIHVPAFQAKAQASAAMALHTLQTPGSRLSKWLAKPTTEAAVDSAFKNFGAKLDPASPVRASAIAMLDQLRGLGAPEVAQGMRLTQLAGLSPPVQVN